MGRHLDTRGVEELEWVGGVSPRVNKQDLGAARVTGVPGGERSEVVNRYSIVPVLYSYYTSTILGLN